MNTIKLKWVWIVENTIKWKSIFGPICSPHPLRSNFIPISLSPPTTSPYSTTHIDSLGYKNTESPLSAHESRHTQYYRYISRKTKASSCSLCNTSLRSSSFGNYPVQSHRHVNNNIILVIITFSRYKLCFCSAEGIRLQGYSPTSIITGTHTFVP